MILKAVSSIYSIATGVIAIGVLYMAFNSRGLYTEQVGGWYFYVMTFLLSGWMISMFGFFKHMKWAYISSASIIIIQQLLLLYLSRWQTSSIALLIVHLVLVFSCLKWYKHLTNEST